MDSFYSREELESFGFLSIGENVLISKKASIYGSSNMSIGNNVRIDDFTVLSGKLVIGNNVHIATHNAIFGGAEGIYFGDFSGVSSRCAIYATSDDYSGEYMTNPTVPSDYTNVISSKIVIGRHVDIGTGSTVLPGVEIGEGCSFGAMTLIAKSTKPWGIYMGYQCIRIKERSNKVLELENEYLNNCKKDGNMF